MEPLAWMRMMSEVRGRYDGTTSENSGTLWPFVSIAILEGDIGSRDG